MRISILQQSILSIHHESLQTHPSHPTPYLSLFNSNKQPNSTHRRLQKMSLLRGSVLAIDYNQHSSDHDHHQRKRNHPRRVASLDRRLQRLIKRLLHHSHAILQLLAHQRRHLRLQRAFHLANSILRQIARLLKLLNHVIQRLIHRYVHSSPLKFLPTILCSSSRFILFSPK